MSNYCEVSLATRDHDAPLSPRQRQAIAEEMAAEQQARDLCTRIFCHHEKHPGSNLCTVHEYLDRVEHFDWVSGADYLATYGAARQAEAVEQAREAMDEVLPLPKLTECMTKAVSERVSLHDLCKGMPRVEVVSKPPRRITEVQFACMSAIGMIAVVLLAIL